MNFKHLATCIVGLLIVGYLNVTGVTAFAQTTVAQPTASAVQFITAEELKQKISKNERLTVIDVRSSTAFFESEDKIKGAIRVKLRKLKSRLALPPLKNVPHDSEVVTYCACPSDEASIRAAQILSESGFKRVRALKNGWQGWLQAKGQLEPRPRLPR
jgi:rhodanese-related sulfurtransferase